LASGVVFVAPVAGVEAFARWTAVSAIAGACSVGLSGSVAVEAFLPVYNGDVTGGVTVLELFFATAVAGASVLCPCGKSKTTTIPITAAAAVACNQGIITTRRRFAG